MVTLRGRLERLEREAEAIPPADELVNVCCVPPGACFAEDRPVGSYLVGDGDALLIVADKRPTREEIDRAIRSHGKKLAPYALVVTSFEG